MRDKLISLAKIKSLSLADIHITEIEQMFRDNKIRLTIVKGRLGRLIAKVTEKQFYYIITKYPNKFRLYKRDYLGKSFLECFKSAPSIIVNKYMEDMQRS